MKIGNFTLLLIFTVLSLAVAELLVRFIDGYSLTTLRLTNTATVKQNMDLERRELPDIFTRHLQSLTIEPRLPPDYFLISPDISRNSAEPDSLLSDRFRKYPRDLKAGIYNWNPNFVRNSLCSKNRQFDGVADLFLFDPLEDSPFPRYRYPVNKALPTGLRTNRYGWRGPDLNPVPSQRTVRLAFVGASTTVSAHNLPFSYPEHIGAYLNAWAEKNGVSVNFEIFNTGHEGTNSSDFAAIMRQEIVPLRPDFIVYFEGSNQFWPAHFVKWKNNILPARPTYTFKEFGWAGRNSAIFKRISSLLTLDGDEPAKRFGPVEWPDDLIETDPSLTHPLLPLNLPDILTDLQDIRKTADSIGAELVLSSFIWLAYEGMKLELPRHMNIYKYLNETFWPFPYSHIRRMSDFQNRVFEKFAQVNGLPFIDVAGAFPMDPNLFSDAIHKNAEGIRLHGWIAANLLIPIIEKRIKSDRLPRPFTAQERMNARSVAAETDVRLVQVEDIMRSCASGISKNQ